MRTAQPLEDAARTAHATTAGPHGLDVLSDVLRTVRLTGALFFPMQASSPWTDEVPSGSTLAGTILPGARHVVSYHIVTRGACWARLGNRPAARLEAGDVLVIPHGDAYAMSSSPDGRSDATPDAVMEFFREMSRTGSRPALVVEGGGGPDQVDVVCGFLACDARPFNPVLEALPRLVHLRRSAGAEPDRLGPLVDFALAESQQRRAGADCVLLRLSEVLFVEVIRRYLQTLPSEERGWLAGLRDPAVGHALALLHERPADPWTIERLARSAATSRSALADRFREFVGQPPMRYLARWRMQLACRLLSEGEAKISAVAGEVGYQSEAAFSRAFKEIVGTSPAAWRAHREREGTESAEGTGSSLGGTGKRR